MRGPRRALAWGLVALLAAAIGGVAATRPGEDVSCGAGFVPMGARCCEGAAHDGVCETSPACPAPLVPVADGCDAPMLRVTVPETTVVVGPSDWEAEGQVKPRTIHVRPFAIDAFEATEGQVHQVRRDKARAAGGLTRDEALAFCDSRGGRLPTDDEWTIAAAGPAARRYPWGDTGAVCRRAAWGLAAGPCSSRGTGPDTVGAHPDGDSPLGLHDLAGNVAEWVAPGAARSPGVARGGSWKTALASDLRSWARMEVDPSTRDPRVGVRCAYDIAP